MARPDPTQIGESVTRSDRIPTHSANKLTRSDRRRSRSPRTHEPRRLDELAIGFSVVRTSRIQSTYNRCRDLCKSEPITATEIVHINIHDVRDHSRRHGSSCSNRRGAHRKRAPEMEPGLRVTGHRVSDFGQVGSGHGSVCQTRCLTRF